MHHAAATRRTIAPPGDVKRRSATPSHADNLLPQLQPRRRFIDLHEDAFFVTESKHRPVCDVP
jgi:hypothetical protein